MGRTTASGLANLLDLEDGPDGALSADGIVAGTYLHGLFERSELRRAILGALAAARGYQWLPAPLQHGRDAYDRLADVMETRVRLDQLRLATPDGAGTGDVQRL
jgi:adenosylcobyric acid synthase